MGRNFLNVYVHKFCNHIVVNNLKVDNLVNNLNVDNNVSNLNVDNDFERQILNIAIFDHNTGSYPHVNINEKLSVDIKREVNKIYLLQMIIR